MGTNTFHQSQLHLNIENILEFIETKPASSDGSGSFTITDDWNELLNSFGDNNPLDQVASENTMVTDWFGYSGMLGYRYYIRPWIGIDFKMGFLNN